MNPLSFLPILLLSGTLTGHAQDLQSILTFADKTRISGQPLTIDAHQHNLTFNAPTLKGESTFQTSKLLEMSLKGEPQAIKSDHYALATIKGHHNDPHRDTLRGRLLHLDQDTITLDTWYAGELTLKRSLVHSLDIFPHSPTFYTGPNGPEGWVSSSGKIADSWIFKNRTMISKTHRGIARKVQIPERAKITVTARWKNAPYFRIIFLSNDGKVDHPNSGYNLNVQQNRLTLFRSTPEQRHTDIFNEAIDNMSVIEQSTITIYLDRTQEGTNAIYLDDQRISTWTDVDDTTLKGEWLHFIPNRNSSIKLSNISVTQWDGTLPISLNDESETQDLQTTAPQLEGQKIRLANGDLVIGEIQNIDKELVHLSTGFGDVRVPLRLMKSIMLSAGKDEDRMEKNDVRAWFHEGGYVTIKLKSFNGKTIKGYSQVYGHADFQVSAFARIQFNIWNQKLDSARISGDLADW